MINLSPLAIFVRMAVCIIGLLLPLILIVMTGEIRPSVSEYFYTSAGPFLVFSFGLISYTMLQQRNWIPSAILLAGVAIFPNQEYPNIHNFSAIVFFMTSSVAILYDKRYRYLGVAMVLSSVTAIWSLMLAESIMIPMISIYHLHRLSVIKKILER